ncbi:MAG: histidine kinase [Wenzhouxiangellaceae bacterium]
MNKSLNLDRHQPADTATALALPLSFRLSRRQLWLLVMLGWTVLAIAASSSAFVAIKGQTLGLWFQVFGRILFYYYIWALLSPVIYLLLTRFDYRPATMPWLILLHLTLFLVTALAMPFLVHSNNWREWLYGDRAIAFHAMNTFSYGFVLSGCLALKYYRLARQQKQASHALNLLTLKLENQLSMARLDSLKMQINPHFLFNALNSIAALIEVRRNDEAYQTVETLGALLRNALEWSDEQWVSLKQELAFIELYLSLEQLRYGDKLQFTAAVPDSILDLKLPALLLQPIIENSIKHAVALSTRPVQIHLQARSDDERLVIDIEDDGTEQSQTESLPGTGIGLNNIRQRLQLIYGSRAAIEYAHKTPQGYGVHLELPLDAASGDTA